MVFLKFYDKYQKILQKSHIYIIIQKKYFQQITPKPTNQTLNINLTMHFQIFHFSTGHIIWHCQHKPIRILSHCNCIGLVPVKSLKCTINSHTSSWFKSSWTSNIVWLKKVFVLRKIWKLSKITKCCIKGTHFKKFISLFKQHLK